MKFLNTSQKHFYPDLLTMPGPHIRVAAVHPTDETPPIDLTHTDLTHTDRTQIDTVGQTRPGVEDGALSPGTQETGTVPSEPARDTADGNIPDLLLRDLDLRHHALQRLFHIPLLHVHLSPQLDL